MARRSMLSAGLRSPRNRPSAHGGTQNLSESPKKAVRWATQGLLAAGALLFGSAACSSGVEDCDPPIPPGTKYKVTVLAETENSNACHVARMPQTFELVAAPKDKTTCGLTPAEWAPFPQPTGFELFRCNASDYQMLGSRCEIRYEADCTGTIDFGLYNPPGVVVDWKAQRIENLLFRVQDSPNCLILDRTRCLDQYRVILERI